MITQASADHYEDIVRLYNQAVSAGSQTADEQPVSLQEKLPWLRLHTGDHYIIYVATIDKDIVGYVALSPYRFGRSAFSKTAEISYYIDNQYQRKGIGSQLIQHAIDNCSELKIESLIAILLSSNLASISVLKKFDFEKWGDMPNIGKLKNGLVDHLYFGKHLGNL
ncbi:MAG: N-acetyltransferase [Immundisolibacteraceae bacterium]|nr:N-acetyltransferase [Immundisolibacteraceae bacterium]